MGSRQWWMGTGVAAVCLGTVQVANAQSAFTLDTFRAAETGNDGFAISSPSALGHLDVGVRLSADYGMNPLIFETRLGDATTEQRSIVSHMLTGNLSLALGLFDHVVVYAGLPATLWSEGDGGGTLPAADGTAVGDPYLGVRLHLLGTHEDAFALGLQLTLSFPLAETVTSGQRFSGERGVAFLPRLMGEIRLAGRRLRLGLNVGARIREPSDLGNLRIHHELTFGAGLIGEIVPDVFDLVAEIYGSTAFETYLDRGGFFGRESTPVEALGGLRVHPSCGWEIGLAAGTGLARGYGAADLRGVLQLGYAHDPHCRAENGSTSQEAPSPVAATASDADGDGLADAEDRCPAEAEDSDGFEDTDGCPDLDNDEDGVPDTDDAAPSDPEDRDGFADQDGRPDPDNDSDGIPDGDDSAPNDPEDIDGFQDTDGAPDDDNDADTVPDANDECPLAPGRTEERGCPRTIRLDTATGTILILQRVEFATNRDVILDRSFPILEEVRAVLAANPQLRRVRIEGHTDDRGIDAENLELSVRRAASVRRWLVEHGIAVERLEAFGCGEPFPTQTNRTNAGRQANRRVEFFIVDPAPTATMRECTPAP